MNALSYEEMCRDENKQGPLCMGLNTVIWDFRLGDGREQSANDLTRKPPPTHGWSEKAQIIGDCGENIVTSVTSLANDSALS